MELASPLPQAGFERPIAGASFGPRLAGQIIDTIVHNLVILLSAFGTGLLLGFIAILAGEDASAFTTKFAGDRLGSAIVALLGYVVYHGICEGLHGATLGKLIMKLHVRQADGAPCGLEPAFIRSLAFLVDSLFFGLVAAGSMGSSELRQRLGDKWAHTVVIERSKLNQGPWPSGVRFVLVWLLAIIVDGGMYSAWMFIKAFA